MKNIISRYIAAREMKKKQDKKQDMEAISKIEELFRLKLQKEIKTQEITAHLLIDIYKIWDFTKSIIPIEEKLKTYHSGITCKYISGINPPGCKERAYLVLKVTIP